MGNKVFIHNGKHAQEHIEVLYHKICFHVITRQKIVEGIWPKQLALHNKAIMLCYILILNQLQILNEYQNIIIKILN